MNRKSMVVTPAFKPINYSLDSISSLRAHAISRNVVSRCVSRN